MRVRERDIIRPRFSPSSFTTISHDHALLEPSISYFSRSTGDSVSENGDPTLNHKPNSV
ncbi:unnamed protein product [Arabidopsis arenosa]|uniref:Uncharacterized protein n=1 Tax=Arabidopsis arenosa TaxID=38785 RepID=A0A8S1ZV73_ARAAE|nr:unnamed protein product [Arabidopsis arenosa]